MGLKRIAVERRDIRATRPMRFLIVVEWAIVPFSLANSVPIPGTQRTSVEIKGNQADLLLLRFVAEYAVVIKLILASKNESPSRLGPQKTKSCTIHGGEFVRLV